MEILHTRGQHCIAFPICKVVVAGRGQSDNSQKRRRKRRRRGAMSGAECLRRAVGGTCTAILRRRYSTVHHHPPLTVTVQEGGIRRIKMNNPQKRNALSLSMLQSLQEDISHEADDRNLRVIVIAAEGPVFSSGHNLKEFTSAQGKSYHAEVFYACVKLMKTIQTVPVPVIAQVNGLATAAGCQLVASCDIAVASDRSKFATPGVNVGLFCSTPAVALGRAVPRKVALEMLFTGEPISAHDALLHGLVNKVVPEENLETETLRIASKICQASRSVVALGKATFYKQISQSLEEAYRLTSQVMLENLALKDGQEGIEAFTQKRKPVWTNS